MNVLVEGFEVDAYWPAARLVIELQSREHHSDWESIERDYAKLADLKRAGHEVLPLTHRALSERAAATVETLRSLISRDPSSSL